MTSETPVLKNIIVRLGRIEYKNLYKNKIVCIAKGIVKDYQLTDDNKKIFSGLLDYFMGLPGIYDLNKGIAIVGNYGAGKSTIMQIFHTFLKTEFPFNPNMFRISSVEEVISEMKSGDIASVLLYNHKDNVSGVKVSRPIHVLINEFGHKYDAKTYGTNVNEHIDMFLMKRYDIFQQEKKLLHITTNYDTKELRSLFHERITDRFKEMFNFIELKGKSWRK